MSVTTPVLWPSVMRTFFIEYGGTSYNLTFMINIVYRLQMWLNNQQFPEWFKVYYTFHHHNNNTHINSQQQTVATITQ